VRHVCVFQLASIGLVDIPNIWEAIGLGRECQQIVQTLGLFEGYQKASDSLNGRYSTDVFTERILQVLSEHVQQGNITSKELWASLKGTKKHRTA
jgi:hypothetical protein